MATIIAILISLGLVGTEADFNNLDQVQQDQLVEIVIVDEQDY